MKTPFTTALSEALHNLTFIMSMADTKFIGGEITKKEYSERINAEVAVASEAIVRLVEQAVPKEINIRDADFPKYLKPRGDETWKQAIRYEQGFNACRDAMLAPIKETK